MTYTIWYTNLFNWKIMCMHQLNDKYFPLHYGYKYTCAPSDLFCQIGVPLAHSKLSSRVGTAQLAVKNQNTFFIFFFFKVQIFWIQNRFKSII